MSRPLRIEYPYACYHVTNRGDNRRIVFNSSDDYRQPSKAQSILCSDTFIEMLKRSKYDPHDTTAVMLRSKYDPHDTMAVMLI